MTDFDLDEINRLMTTTKQVRKRLNLERSVPNELLLECIEIAGHAPVGGNLERNRWLIVTEPELKNEIAKAYRSVGLPYLQANQGAHADSRTAKVIDSSIYLIENMHKVPAMVIPLRLDRPPVREDEVGSVAGYFGSVLPSVWSFQLAARARGVGSAWTTFHLAHEEAIAKLLGVPSSVTQCALLPVAFYKGDNFSPAPRKKASEITYLNQWKHSLL